MKNAVLILGLSLSGFMRVGAQCTPAAGSIYTFTYKEARYELVKENLSWENAAECARHRGGRLAEIRSKEKQDTINYFLNLAGITASSTVAPDGGGASYIWIGANDRNSEGKWLWDGDNRGPSNTFFVGQYPSGTTSGSGHYVNWGKEPDDFSGQDGLGLALTDWSNGVRGQWNDLATSNALYYLIEYPASCNMTKKLHCSDHILFVGEHYADYFWVECPSMELIPGAREGIMHLSGHEGYAVIVGNMSGTCIDTSDCYYPVPAGIEEQIGNSVQVFTLNAQNGLYQVKLPENMGKSMISISNTAGLVIYRETTMNSSIDINLNTAPAGMYMLKIENEKMGSSNEKLIKW